MKTSMPDEAPHFFSGVNFNLLKEIHYPTLVVMCQTAKQLGKEEKFKYLTDALRMYQFARIAAQQAMELENSMVKAHLDQKSLELSMNPVQLSKCVCDFITYVKSTLDRIALFYNSYFDLGNKEQSCDFKWETFQKKLLVVAPHLTDYLAKYENWLSKDSSSTLSIFPLRDKWIHESYPIARMALPIEIKLGLFPIPKDFNAADHVSLETHMRSDHFFNFHGHALTELFNTTLLMIKNLQLQVVGSLEISEHLLLTPISFTHLIYIRKEFTTENIRVDSRYWKC